MADFIIDPDRFAIEEHWIEKRTKSGRWSRIKYDCEARVIDRASYDRVVGCPWQGERQDRMYTRAGFLVWRVVTPRPDGEVRAVRVYTFLDSYLNVERARAKFPDLFPPTFYDLIVGHSFMLDCVGDFFRVEDAEDYASVVKAAGQFGDWVAGTLARYDADNDRYVFDYVTANFEGRIGSITRIEGDPELFDPNVEDVVYPMPGWAD
ncbi:hypothetical protein HMPREF3167_03345 [Trueperella sp. HMSC08B05]|uniref:hypothetical protein n=1 Tax=Trueperella sp. HMSC08B05 TaxID=1581135 RepID=UPI0008A62A2F|nr:hypothetical protein [Trueperella sp. HMSC08B05]OFS75647.1 hypothetical protein HMPREF3167_03345 [Trueperella sp. HMSC08B05]